MMVGHIAAGYFTTYYLMRRYKLLWRWPWFALGLFASIIPDLDIFYQMYVNKLYLTHRYYFTYIPLFYLVVFIFCLLVQLIFKKKWLKYAILIIFANIFVHLLLDTPFYGIMWLWPFYKGLIGIYDVGGNGGIFVKNYWHHWYFYSEIVLWILAIYHLITTYGKTLLKKRVK
jgi:inner membrane protein